MVRLEARGRTPENHERPVLVSQVESEFTGMVARGGVLLLERGIVLFVQNHDIEIERRKYRAAGPKNHTRAPLQYRHEGFTPFGGRERRMQHLHRNMQEFLKTARRLRSEPDFGNQDKHAHVASQRLERQLLVHAGLARTSNAMQKRTAEPRARKVAY